MITAKTMAEHKARWFVYVGEPATNSYQKTPYVSTMRGTWGYDVECSCGEFKTSTGGGLRRYVAELLWDHRFSAQVENEES